MTLLLCSDRLALGRKITHALDKLMFIQVRKLIRHGDTIKDNPAITIRPIATGEGFEKNNEILVFAPELLKSISHAEQGNRQTL